MRASRASQGGLNVRRLLIIIAVLAVIVAAGVSGLWFMNRGVAKDLIVAALDDAKAAGVDVVYDDLSIGGFPLGYEGTLTNVVAQNASAGVQISFPSASASVSVTDPDTVIFNLPAEATLIDLAPGGELTGRPTKVTADAAVLAITPGGVDEYDFAFQADRVRMAPDIDGATDFVEFASPRAEGDLTIDRANQTGAVSVAFETAGVDSSFQAADAQGEPADAILKIGPVNANLAASDERITLDVEYASFEFELADAATATATDVRYRMVATPKVGQSLAIGQVFQSSVTPDTLSAAGLQLARAIAQGGAFDLTSEVGALNFATSSAPSDADAPGSLSFESQGYALNAKVNPSEMAIIFSADTLIYDMEIPDAAAAGANAMAYSLNGVNFELSADAADAFNLAPMLSAEDEDAAAQAFWDALRSQIAAGGRAGLDIQLAAADSLMALNDPSLPFSSLASKSGPQSTKIELTADTASLASDSQGITYEVAGGIAGAIAFDRLVLDAAAPMRRSEDPQSATMLFDINTVTIDDSLWAFVDPGQKLDRTIRGLKVDLDAAVRVREDLLLLEADDLSGPPPFDADSVQVRQVLLELLGAKAEASGDVNVQPLPPTADLTVVVSNWRAMLSSVVETPFGAAPMAQMSVSMVRGFMEDYGQPGADPESTVLNLAYDGLELAVNGRPFPPRPPEPIPDAPLADETPDVTAEPPEAETESAPEPAPETVEE